LALPAFEQIKKISQEWQQCKLTEFLRRLAASHFLFMGVNGESRVCAGNEFSMLNSAFSRERTGPQMAAEYQLKRCYKVGSSGLQWKCQAQGKARSMCALVRAPTV
jgi:hypothetical protein